MNKTIWLTVQRCLADAEQERLASRAIVALSDDRQWLVVLEKFAWLALGKIGAGMMTRYEFRYILTDDTGQDAHEVLAAWLEGRGQ